MKVVPAWVLCGIYLTAAILQSQIVHAQPVDEPTTAAKAGSGSAGLWQLRSKHLIWGMPRQIDNRHNVLYPGETQARPGVSVLVREGFVVGHYDLYKVPAWVSVRWTREDHDELLDGSLPRNFGPDPELPLYARAGTSYDFSSSHMERGHMARHEDNESWGRDNSDTGCLMSNIVPQHKDMNGEAWNDLENMHQEMVTASSIDTVWIISGPLFQNDAPEFMVGNAVAVPKATYKIVGWFTNDGVFHARGFVVKQDDRIRNDPAHYFTPIREIEQATGLNFFPNLPADRADAIETILPTDLWGTGTEGLGRETTGVLVRIETLLPNPVGDESINEAVTIRNAGSFDVMLDGWLLKDEAGKTWELAGVLDAGDEKTCKRNGQPMAMNNGGDTIHLLRPNRSKADSVTYESAAEGAILVAHPVR